MPFESSATADLRHSMRSTGWTQETGADPIRFPRETVEFLSLLLPKRSSHLATPGWVEALLFLRLPFLSVLVGCACVSLFSSANSPATQRASLRRAVLLPLPKSVEACTYVGNPLFSLVAFLMGGSVFIWGGGKGHACAHVMYVCKQKIKVKRQRKCAGPRLARTASKGAPYGIDNVDGQVRGLSDGTVLLAQFCRIT